MKFRYQYRTKDNKLHHGEVSAPNRDAVYVLLREKGIRPSRVEEAPGFLNAVLGKGKRWIAIVSLVVLVLILVCVLILLRQANKDLVIESMDKDVYERRSQIYGDPGVLRECSAQKWGNVFDSAGDRLLAAFAVPGNVGVSSSSKDLSMEESSFLACVQTNVVVSANDLAEVAKMKRMVNWMKREARTYLSSGGTVRSYIERLQERQREELDVFYRMKKILQNSQNEAQWRDVNSRLRAMGLPMIDRTEDHND